MKIVIFLLVLSNSIKCYSQIEQVELKSKPNTSTQTFKYDSTIFDNTNMRDDDKVGGLVKESDLNYVKRFIGQEVIVLPKSHKYIHNDIYAFVGYGANYDGDSKFYRKFDMIQDIRTKVYNPVKGGDIGSYIDYLTDYNSLAGKKLKISDILHDIKFSANKPCYKLINESNEDIIYYYGQKSYLYNRMELYNIPEPFLVVGYFEKLKQTYLNKDFIFSNKNTRNKNTRNKNLIDNENLIDNNTGNNIDDFINSEWKCTKIALADYTDSKYQKITIILYNNNGNEIAMELKKFQIQFISKEQYIEQIENEQIENEKIEKEKRNKEKEKQENEEKLIAIKQIENEKIEKEKINREKQEKLIDKKNIENIKLAKANNEIKKKLRKENLIKKYGYEYGTTIFEGQVAIGMTKEMCIDAWGKPHDINRTVGKEYIMEQWVYNLKSYLYFDKSGLLKTIQN